jgi:hypothetical protein
MCFLVTGLVMSFTFYLFNRDAWTDPNQMLRSDNNSGNANTGQTITLSNPASGQVVTVNGNRLEDSSSAAGGLSQPYTISGRSFAAGTSIEMDYGFILRDANGIDYFVGKIKVAGSTDSEYNGSVMSQGWDRVNQQWVGPPAIGTTFTLIEVTNSNYPGALNPWRSSSSSGPGVATSNLNPYSNDVRLGQGIGAPVLDTAFFPVCFVAGTLIETADGLRAVETLVPGDLVMTADHGLRPLVWTGSRMVNAAELQSRPKWRPVRIAAGALGVNLPARDVLLSPQHRVLVRSKIALRMFDASEVLVAAKDLVGLPGITLAEDVAEVHYVHLMFDSHQIIFAEGAPMESFFVGPMSLATLDCEARREVLALMPDLAPAPARHMVRGTSARKMAQRHQAKARHLIAS